MELTFKKYKCSIKLGQYSNHRLAIQLVSSVSDLSQDIYLGSPIATATLNIPEYNLKDNEIIIKDYSENQGMLDVLIKNGLVYDPYPLETGYTNATVAKKTQILMELEKEANFQQPSSRKNKI